MLGTISFIFGLVLAVIGVIVVFAGLANRSPGMIGGGLAFAVLLGGAFIIGPMVGSVDAKKVGVVTSLKKPTGEIKQSGGYMIAPWKNVTEMDAAAQTKSYQFDVQLAAGSKATLVIYPNWNMVETAAPELYQNYKSFDNMVTSLFDQQLVSTANNIFASYSPIKDVDSKTGQLKKSKTVWAAELKAALEANTLIAGKIKINSLSIPTIQPDKETQDNLNKVVAEYARGSLLDQQKINADKQKLITETNAEVDQATRCLEIAEKNGTDPGVCGLFVGNSNAGILVNAGGTKK